MLAGIINTFLIAAALLIATAAAADAGRRSGHRRTVNRPFGVLIGCLVAVLLPVIAALPLLFLHRLRAPYLAVGTVLLWLTLLELLKPHPWQTQPPPSQAPRLTAAASLPSACCGLLGVALAVSLGR